MSSSSRLPYSRVKLPSDLRERLPWLLRYSEHAVVTPAAIIAIVLLFNQRILIAAVLLIGSAWAKIGFDWMAARWLMRHSLWQPGTHYSTLLPLRYKFQAVFLLLITLTAGGAYAVLEAGIRSQPVFLITCAAVALLPFAYLGVTLVSGVVGGGYPGWSRDWRDQNPAGFWMGLAMYMAVAFVFVAILLFVLIKTYYGDAGRG